MKRIFWALLLLFPLAGCAGFEEFAFNEFNAGAPCARPPVSSCGVSQVSGSLPMQTAEPPR